MTKEQLEAIHNIPTAYGKFGDLMRHALSKSKVDLDNSLLDAREAWDNWCKWQDGINAEGGPGSFPTTPIRAGDRLTQYGFNVGGEPPNRCGVYAVCAAGPTEHLLYIGSSQHIRTRLMDKKHPYFRLRERLGERIYLRWLVTDDWRPIECSLIQTLKPPFNVANKNGSTWWKNKRKQYGR